MTWSKKQPKPPDEGTVSYMYYDIKEEDMWLVKIYKGCWKLYGYEGLWWHEPTELPQLPTQEDINGSGKEKTKSS